MWYNAIILSSLHKIIMTLSIYIQFVVYVLQKTYFFIKYESQFVRQNIYTDSAVKQGRKVSVIILNRI